MTYRDRLKITLENSIYDHNFEEFTVPLKDMDWLINQAECVEGLEAKYSRLEESLKKQTTNAFDGWEKVIELEREKEDYEQALEFYGNEGNYKTVIENDKEIIFLGTSVAQMDGGEAARKVLDFSGNEGDLDE